MDSSDTLALTESTRQRASAPSSDATPINEGTLLSGIAIHDRELRCIAWSYLFARLSGLPKAAALHSHSTVDTSLLQALGGKPALESALAGGTLTLAHTLISPPGQLPCWIACTHTALYGADGMIIGTITQLSDVSAQTSALHQMQSVLEEYQDLYHQSPSGHHSFDADGVFTKINNTELQWLGYSREEVIGRLRMTDILTPESAISCKLNLQKLSSAGKLDEIEYDIVRKDGTVFPAVLNGKATYTEDGKFSGGRVTMVNISERRRIENDLRLSDANLRRGQMLAQFGNYKFGTAPGENNKTFHWSDEMYRILGRDPLDGPIATTFYIEQIIHPDDRAFVQEAVRLAVENGTRFELAYRIVRPDREIRHVRDLGDLDEKISDESGYFFGVMQDVTDLHHAQAAVNQREHLLASLVENSYEGIALFKANGQVCFVSPGATRILGYRAAEFLNMSVYDYMHTEDVARVIGWAKELFRTPGQRVTDEFRFRTKNGTWLWLEVMQSNQLHIEAVGAIVCNFRDITARKLADTELLKTNNRLRELTQHLRVSTETERTRIARELHDELGSILTTVKIYLTGSIPALAIINGRQASNTRALELLDSASASVARIVTNLRPSVLDNLGLLPAIKWLGRQLEEQTGISCEVAALPDVFDDALSDDEKIALFRICQEALNNIARHAKASHAAIEIQRQGEQLQIEIRDDGIGHTPERATNSTSWGIIGMRERVIELGGTLEIQTQPHAGTVVRAIVPWRWQDTLQTARLGE
jgi:PAS domain S-box-containing protein